MKIYKASAKYPDRPPASVRVTEKDLQLLAYDVWYFHVSPDARPDERFYPPITSYKTIEEAVKKYVNDFQLYHEVDEDDDDFEYDFGNSDDRQLVVDILADMGYHTRGSIQADLGIPSS